MYSNWILYYVLYFSRHFKFFKRLWSLVLYFAARCQIGDWRKRRRHVGGVGGRGRDLGKCAPRREYLSTWGVGVGVGGGGTESEAREKKVGWGVVAAPVAAADRLLTMDVEWSSTRSRCVWSLRLNWRGPNFFRCPSDLPRRSSPPKGSRLRAVKAGGGGHRWSGAVNLLS